MSHNKPVHSYHMVSPSPWPVLTALSIFLIMLLTILNLKNLLSFNMIIFALFNLIFFLVFWWRDVIREATFLEKHSEYAQKGLKIGMFLFIISEVMFFFSFFWVYFHAALAPTVRIGCIWPPYGLETFSPFGVPLLNTIILLLSGAAITTAHYAFLRNDRILTFKSFVVTIFLAAIFTMLQVYEYLNAPFSINTSIYGSVFFLLTGFHGFHVIVGTIFIVVCFFRFINYHFKAEQHIGLIAAIWYWHFVDVVWIFLYFFVYFLGYYNFFF